MQFQLSCSKSIEVATTEQKVMRFFSSSSSRSNVCGMQEEENAMIISHNLLCFSKLPCNDISSTEEILK